MLGGIGWPPWDSESHTCISLSITNLSHLNNRAQRHFQNNHQVTFKNHMFLRPVVTVTFDPPSQIIWRTFLGGLDLPKVKAELLASRLKQWNLLQSGVVATSPVVLRWMCDSPRTGCAWRTTPFIYVARTSNNRVIMACELYCCLLPQCEALRICRSGFPIATKWCCDQDVEVVRSSVFTQRTCDRCGSL